MPDSYGIDISFKDGRSEHIDVVSHALIAESTILETFGVDDMFRWFPIADIHVLQFDKKFTKVIELKNAMNKQGEK